MSKWISTSERLPDAPDYTSFLVLVDGSRQPVPLIGMWRKETGDWDVIFIDGPKVPTLRRVTHWMPIPPAPFLDPA